MARSVAGLHPMVLGSLGHGVWWEKPLRDEIQVIPALSLPHASAKNLRCCLPLGLCFLILTRGHWFIPGIDNFFCQESLVRILGLAGHMICAVLTLPHYRVQKQATDHSGEHGWAPNETLLKVAETWISYNFGGQKYAMKYNPSLDFFQPFKNITTILSSRAI